MKIKTSIVLPALLLALAPIVSAQSMSPLTALHDFQPPTDGDSPEAALVEGSDGALYGTTTVGNTDNGGAFFKLTPAGEFTVLHVFVTSDGLRPSGGVTLGTDGNFYGTTEAGGSTNFNAGTIFKLTPAGKIDVLYDYQNGNDGIGCNSTLVQGSDGDFYGANQTRVFRMTPAGAFSVLAALGSSVGQYGEGALVEGEAGVFYGVTLGGGTFSQGTIYDVHSDGTDFRDLWEFNDNDVDGFRADAGLIKASDGNFYGTTSQGGPSDDGTVYRISADGSFKTLHSFTGGASDGATPQCALVEGPDGNFYGTTEAGGPDDQGTVFKMTPAGKVTILANFLNSEPNGVEPYAGLCLASDGNLYGTTLGGGANGGLGTIFKLVGPPIITSTATASGKVGQTFSYQIVATSSPTSYAAKELPAGLTLNAGTGVISGKPTAAGTTMVTLSATNSVSTTAASINVTIVAQSTPPAITSAATATAEQGKAFSYHITATNDPTSFNATGLPSGLSVNKATGVISGTLVSTASGVKTINLSATNAVGTGTAKLSLDILAPPVITSAATATATTGKAFSYQITASHDPTSFNATGLPSGLTANKTTGVISGALASTASGVKTINLTATNEAGMGTAALTLTVTSTPKITSALTATATVGKAFSYQITATNDPASFNATGRPAGITVNAQTGLIPGTPASTAIGTKMLTLSATNSAGKGNETLTLTITQ